MVCLLLESKINKLITLDVGIFATIGLKRTLIDNLELGWSAIGKVHCIVPGERNPHWIDADLNYGIDYRYGYTQDACATTSKQEMLARELLACTFNPLQGDNMPRCTANQSVSYHRSFLDNNSTPTAHISVVRLEGKPDLKRRYDKACPANCVDDR